MTIPQFNMLCSILEDVSAEMEEQTVETPAAVDYEEAMKLVSRLTYLVHRTMVTRDGDLERTFYDQQPRLQFLLDSRKVF
jgi:hypothetical protein